MRWKKDPKPKVGDARIDRFFLIFPITIGCETRWLEMANIEYEWWEYACGTMYEKPVRWVD